MKWWKSFHNIRRDKSGGRTRGQENVESKIRADAQPCFYELVAIFYMHVQRSGNRGHAGARERLVSGSMI